jgi:type VI secretion system protein
MPKMRLSERLTHAAMSRTSVGLAADSLTRKSIIDHLTRLLNTRQGSVPIDPHYGLSDLSNIAGSLAAGTTEAICEEVALQVNRYEPRLTNVRIIASNSSQERQVIALRFELSARMVNSQKAPTENLVSLLMRIDASGRVSLQSRQDY